jgi:hypothetical protein
MTRLLILSLFAALALGSAGCAFSRTVINGPDLRERISRVEPGRTQADDLERILGTPPTSITPVGDGRVYAWSFGEGKTAGLNLILLNVNKTNLGIDTALFYVDAQDVVRQVSVGQNSREIPWEWWAFGD